MILPQALDLAFEPDRFCPFSWDVREGPPYTEEASKTFYKYLDEGCIEGPGVKVTLIATEGVLTDIKVECEPFQYRNPNPPTDSFYFDYSEWITSPNCRIHRRFPLNPAETPLNWLLPWLEHIPGLALGFARFNLLPRQELLDLGLLEGLTSHERIRLIDWLDESGLLLPQARDPG